MWLMRMPDPMLSRFCLYGFLKNQLYFEPFLILAFRARGLDYFQIGLLVALRYVVLAIVEIPSGAIADLWGKRRTMVVAFSVYIVAFGILALTGRLFLMGTAMALLGLGDAFRSGTHKALILSWLTIHDREDESTQIYGITRSWSKLGSSLSALIAGCLVFFQGEYTSVFWFAIIPYALDLINLATYPAELDEISINKPSLAEIWEHLHTAMRDIVDSHNLPLLLTESMCFHGLYASCKDYLQPIVMAAAVSLPFFVGVDLPQRTALLIAIVFSLLHLLESAAARASHILGGKDKNNERAARIIWAAQALVMFGLLNFLFDGNYWVSIAGFLALAILNNLFRPNVIGRIATESPPATRATVLSAESQLKSIFVAIMSPLLGLAVDASGFWPVAACGVLVSLVMTLARELHSRQKHRHHY